ncbi:MAG: metallophosphoesterase [Anaerolineae bacterium]
MMILKSNRGTVYILWLLGLGLLASCTPSAETPGASPQVVTEPPGTVAPNPTIAVGTSAPLVVTPAPNATRIRPGTPPTTAVTVVPDPVVLAAGDIAVCGTPQDAATAKLLLNTPGTVLALGDEAYPNGAASDFANCYNPSWGQVKARTHPVPGNHEYLTTGAAGYFGYFGVAAGPAGKGYYSFDLGAWHLIALNSEIPVNAGSPQEEWLRADLATHRAACTLAYWHQPRFSSGPHGSNNAYQPLWQALYDSGAELVLNGHDHDYERFALQEPDGVPAPAHGIREFVVGTGGAGLYPPVLIASNSEVRNNTSWGVLKLTLHAAGYDWQFISINPQESVDSGSGVCH